MAGGLRDGLRRAVACLVTRRGAWALVCWIGLGGLSPGVAGADVLDTWLARQEGLRTWSAQFRQVRQLAVLKEPLVSTGRVWFAEPGLFRWELGNPVQTLALRGTQELAVIYPRLQRAERHAIARLERGPMREMLALLDAGFPRSRGGLEERFRVASVEALDGGVSRVRLEPKSAEARRMMLEVRIEFTPEEQGPRATELRFADGSVLRNEFSAVDVNPALAPDWFAVSIPEGFKVVGDRP